MIVPLQWLKKYIRLEDEPHDIAEMFTLIGHMLDKPLFTFENDTVFNLEVRQNRPDCLSILGLARDLAAYKKVPLQDIELVDIPNGDGKETSVIIKDPSLCYRFNTVIIRDIKVADSPDWIKSCLKSYGIEPINNVVDITNYVMIETGQPLHAFDLYKIKLPLSIDKAGDNSNGFIGLGNINIDLDPSDIVIRDQDSVVALAGIIGGEQSKVTEETTSILLEAATYKHTSIRKTSRKHDIRTEASLRLEKILHPRLTEIALKRCCYLLKEVNNSCTFHNIDAYPRKRDQISISLKQTHVEKTGGVKVSKDEIIDTLNFLNFSYKITDHEFIIDPPYWRTDLQIEADIIEEILRMKGYGNIPSTPLSSAAPLNIHDKMSDLEESVRNTMIALGYDEQITEPLTHDGMKDHDSIILRNSLSSEKSILRKTLKHQLEFGLFNRKKYKENNIRLFEVGKLYFLRDGKYVENEVVSAICMDKEMSYYNFKGHVDALFQKIGFEYDVSLVNIEIYNKDGIDIYFFELNLSDLFKLGKRVSVEKVYVSPPHIIFEDISFSVPVTSKVGLIINKIYTIDNNIFDIRLGENPILNDEKKSVFLKIQFHDPAKQLTRNDVLPVKNKIKEVLIADCKAVFD